MKKLKIGVLGATGAVGQEMLKILEDGAPPAGERAQRGQPDPLPGTGRGHPGRDGREL